VTYIGRITASYTQVFGRTAKSGELGESRGIEGIIGLTTTAM